MELIFLDTGILIAHKRAKKPDKSATQLSRLAAQGYRFAVSSITVFELLRGNMHDEDGYWVSLLANMEVFPFDAACAEQAASIYQRLQQSGQRIEAEDLFICATVLRHGLKLATGNARHFSWIAGLQLIADD